MPLVKANFRPLNGEERNVAVTSAQLHAHACIICGNAPGGLQPAGHVYTPVADGEVGWLVVACPTHRTGEAA
ncbi:hypothetical protein [Streptacidiphilus pinicola]|uniref:hypothetical protein n=1 Tax=Streptacidiphilus pinicola TaxID=2219663 RepID=UPI001057C89F|nr:hypothetical protein [Streptacidiphilus pinicola]